MGVRLRCAIGTHCMEVRLRLLGSQLGRKGTHHVCEAARLGPWSHFGRHEYDLGVKIQHVSS